MTDKEKELLDAYNQLSDNDLTQLTPQEQTEYGDLLEKSKATQATQAVPQQAPSTYSYLPGDYEDLKHNVGRVGYSGLDERQKALFQSQFPNSKFAKAGGSFEDAVKYVDQNAEVGPIQEQPYTMESALPGEYSTDPRLQQFVKEHPGTALATAASIPLTGGTTTPGMVAGILGSGALGAGGTYVDERLAGNPNAGQSSLISGLISGATHGVGTGLTWLGKKIAAPVIASLAKKAEAEVAAKAFSEGLKKEAISASDAEVRLLKALGKEPGAEEFLMRADLKGRDIEDLVNMPPEKLRLAIAEMPEHVRSAVYQKIANMMKKTLPEYSALGKTNAGTFMETGALNPTEAEVGKYVLQTLNPVEAKGWNLAAMAPNKYRVPFETFIGDVPYASKLNLTNNFWVPTKLNQVAPLFEGLGGVVAPSLGSAGGRVRRDWEK